MTTTETRDLIRSMQTLAEEQRELALNATAQGRDGRAKSLREQAASNDRLAKTLSSGAEILRAGHHAD